MTTLKKTSLSLFLICTLFFKLASAPRLGVIIIIDQFAYHYIPKIKPYITGGLKRLLNDGQVYTNAYMPHSYPGTGPGHVTVATGAYPKDHGIIGNSWLDNSGKKTNYEKIGINPKYAEFSPEGTYPHGISAGNIMTDNFADQFVLKSRPNKSYKVFAIAHKSRAAVGMAGKLGKAIWFDKKGRQFTSSKAYFEKLPDWLTSFNKNYVVDAVPKAVTWSLFYKNAIEPYRFFDINNYKYANTPYSLINVPFKKLTADLKNEYGELYIKIPHANQHLFDLAKKCLDENLKVGANPTAEGDHMLLIVSLSPLDPLGHFYGPDSQEVFDMLYHIDWQIEQFMEEIEKKWAKATKGKKEKVFFMLTADHGVMPIIEILQDRGIKNVRRIAPSPLIKEMNALIAQKHNIKDLIIKYLTPQFYVDREKFNALTKEQRRAVSRTVKQFLEKVPGIAEVWCYEKLKKLPAAKHSVEEWFKNQLYPGRSGQFFCRTNPYCVITSHQHGTQHKTPYEYDSSFWELGVGFSCACAQGF